jgi:hypothetical protein
MKHITGLGYVVQDTLSGADVYDDTGNLVCQLPQSLSHFEDDNGNIDDDALEEAIHDEEEVEAFLDYQSDYC